MDRAACQRLDQEDPLSRVRARFMSPKKDTIFLDANSIHANKLQLFLFIF